MMLIDNKFEIGQTVYLKTDLNQLPRFVTSISIRQGRIIYAVTNATTESWHDDFEISSEKNLVTS
jgi:hypothetical protein